MAGQKFFNTRGVFGSVRNLIMIVILARLAIRTEGSAIPMWEFLSRDEKISHLYTIFSKQVARYCSDSPLPDCNKNLLITGLRNVANMDENEIDKMDPYQRDSNDLIWRGMIGNNRLPLKYEHEDSYYATEADPLATSDNNGLGEELPSSSSSSGDYVRPSEHSGPYLVGPMVIRVFPDGRPVPEDISRPLPRDEDVEEMKYSKIPSIADIESASDRKFHYAKPSYENSPIANKLMVYGYGKPSQRSSLIVTTKDSQRRNVNPLFRDRRGSEIAYNPRIVRFY